MKNLKPVKHIKKTDLDNLSGCKANCPECKEGMLLMRRDKNLKLMNSDYCVLCGQQFIYDDLEEWKKHNGIN